MPQEADAKRDGVKKPQQPTNPHKIIVKDRVGDSLCDIFLEGSRKKFLKSSRGNEIIWGSDRSETVN